LNILKPLMKEIKLKIEDGKEWIQLIECDNMPVQYRICESYEHYAKDFSKKKKRDKKRREKEKQEKDTQDK